MSKETALNTLLEQKLQLLNTYANIGMLWWVSSVVFCGSILGGIWVRRREVAKAPFFGYLGVILGVFFFSIVLFGFRMIIETLSLSAETYSVMVGLGVKQFSEHAGFRAVWIGYGIGTTSFVFVTITWSVLWRTIARERRQLSNQKHES